MGLLIVQREFAEDDVNDICALGRLEIESCDHFICDAFDGVTREIEIDEHAKDGGLPVGVCAREVEGECDNVGSSGGWDIGGDGVEGGSVRLRERRSGWSE